MKLLSTLAGLFLGAALAFSAPVLAQDEEGYMPEDYEEEEGADDFEGDSGDDFADDEAGDEGSDSEDEFGDEAAADEGYDSGDDFGDDTAGGMDAAEEDAAGSEGDYQDFGYDDFGYEDAGGFAEEGSVETVEVFSAEEEEEPEEPWHLYVGLGQAITTMSLSGLPPDAENDFDSGIIQARAGMQLFENIDLELQVGSGQDADAPDEVTTDSYYGLFLVPSTNLFDVVELSMPVGYARSTVEDEDFDSAAFGINVNVPLRYYAESLPDIRLVGGWMIYYQKADARLYGFTAGLRYDFDFGGDPDWEEGGGLGF